MKLLLVGAGRMGQRHLRGLAAFEGQIVVVDPRPEAEPATRALAEEAGLRALLSFEASLDAALASSGFDAAVLAETAAGRLERVEALAAAGVRNLLVEKPLEQSRARLDAIRSLARRASLDVRCNHYYRRIPFVRDLAGRGPTQISVTGGAWGLACNGIHWLDLAVFVAGGPGRFAAAVVDRRPIESGRGAAFRDYGGFGLFDFPDGGTLYLASDAGGSAPMAATISQPGRQWLLPLSEETGILYERDPSSTKPHYLYGADYTRRDAPALEFGYLTESAAAWVSELGGGVDSGLPSLEQAAVAHEMLFDLLESSGETEFAFT